jgi:hypothetical protein
MTAIALPPQLAFAAYRSALAGARAALADNAGPSAEDRGNLLDVVVGPRRAAVQTPTRRALLAGIPTRHALPLTAASGC